MHIHKSMYTDYTDYLHTQTRTHTQTQLSRGIVSYNASEKTIALSTAVSVSPDLILTGNTFCPLIKVSMQARCGRTYLI